mgnify:FL=1
MKNFITLVVVVTFFILQSSCKSSVDSAFDCFVEDFEVSVNGDLDSLTSGLMHFNFNYEVADAISLRDVTWHFGDGESAQGETVDHQYAGSGHYDAVINYSFNMAGGGYCDGSTTKSINIP